jgi:glycosyltransferase involved in cell wall biosynthesis
MTHIPDVSLLVCTRDRCASLAATLASIVRAVEAAPALHIEAVIVDNGSRDGTRSLLEEWAVGCAFPIRLVHEAQPGLARARNAGLAHIRGRIVAMTDDDCLLHHDYFTALALAFGEAEGAAIIGGRILPGDPADLPVTVKLEDHPMEALPGAFPGGFVMGANLAFTADILGHIGAFDERFGAGAPFVAAEDTDFLFRAMRRGIPLRYDPHFAVDHHHGRRRIEEETRLLAGYAYGDGALYAKHLLHDRRVVAAIVRDLQDLWRDVVDPVTTHAGIRRFYLFRLRHKVRGFLAYWRQSLRRSG